MISAHMQSADSPHSYSEYLFMPPSDICIITLKPDITYDM